MTTTLTNPSRAAAADATLARLNAGAGPAVIQYQTAAGVEVATLTMSDPAFPPSVNGVATASAITADPAATGGTVARAVFMDSDLTEVFRVDVTGPAGDGEIKFTSNESLVVGAGDIIALSSFTYTVPATDA